MLRQTLTHWEIEDWRHNSLPLIQLMKAKPHTWGVVMREVFGNDQMKCKVATQADQVYYESDPNHRYQLVIGLGTWWRTIRAVNMISVDPNVDIKAILMKRKRVIIAKTKRGGPVDEDDEGVDGSRQEDPRKCRKTTQYTRSL